MKINIQRAALIVLVMAASLPAFAQSGCVDSPEASTAVLFLVGAAGVSCRCGLLQRAFSRIRRR